MAGTRKAVGHWHYSQLLHAPAAPISSQVSQASQVFVAIDLFPGLSQRIGGAHDLAGEVIQHEWNHENKKAFYRPLPCAWSGWLLAAGVRAGHRRARQGSDREVFSGEAAIFSIRGQTVSNAGLLG